ncbi:MAG: glycosyltransferase [Methylococcales bacterium]|nr:glycosyltransferase [Methylococcales bacterium]MDD5631282.1 glycosyltransferase [Methylococcales bacterium]
MNIMFLSRTLRRGGGAETQLAVLAKGLHSRGHQVTVAVFYGGGEFEEELIEAGVNVVDLKKKGFWDVIGFMNNYFKLLKVIHPDVLHGYITIQNLLALLNRLYSSKTKIVWGLRDSNIGLGHIPLSERIFFKLSCWLSHKTDLIISNSEAGKRFHANKGYPVNLIEVVPNGIDTKKFQRQASGRQLLRQQWGVSNAQVLIGNVARLDRKKDHSTFFQACAVLLKEYPNVKIICAGQDSVRYRTELDILARELMLQDHLIWAGECSDMASVYSALDLEVSSSLYEGLPNVVAEAMSCCVPVVATDVGDVRLVLEGIGICVPPGDPVALSEAMSMMLQRDLSDVGRRGRERIVERYSVDKLINRTESLLEALLEKK